MTKVIFLSLIFLSSLFASPLQDAISKAKPYATIKLKAGTYFGNIIINKPLRLIGEEKGVIIDGKKKGTVISINSSDVFLANITVINSGRVMHTLDSAINIRNSSNVHITNCAIKKSLYGFNIYMVKNSSFSDNNITSLREEIQLRGDAFKIWYSNNNTINNNIIDTVRDFTLNYSNKNIIKNNTFSNSRFALHINHSNQSLVKNNIFKYNSVSIMLMGAKDTNISHNQILSSKGAAGIGVLVKGVKNFHFQRNRVSFNAIGIYVDSKSTEIGKQRYFRNNTLSYNKVAMHFHMDILNNTITHNTFEGNIDDIIKNTRNNTTHNNEVHHNYWDRYAGFDKNKDNIGDRPYKIYLYADKIWQYYPKLKFFYATPIISILNFIAQLTPVIEPILILEDTHPFIHKPIKGLTF